jgi:hypothetical protein
MYIIIIIIIIINQLNFNFNSQLDILHCELVGF